MPKLTTLKSGLQGMPKPKVQGMQDGSWRTSTMSAAARGYDHAWRKRRDDQLRAEPLCRKCMARGEARIATVADHITPHRGDPILFAGPLQSLCKTCHDGEKAAEERAAGLR